uniref:Uncharacterized protein n=1 Tax=Populus alba TaxID=43335 RepID=A0A4U5Q487_POPAL|nr:hypothetical protein D5086_0000141470 [Populus alba]
MPPLTIPPLFLILSTGITTAPSSSQSGQDPLLADPSQQLLLPADPRSPTLPRTRSPQQQRRPHSLGRLPTATEKQLHRAVPPCIDRPPAAAQPPPDLSSSPNTAAPTDLNPVCLRRPATSPTSSSPPPDLPPVEEGTNRRHEER